MFCYAIGGTDDSGLNTAFMDLYGATSIGDKEIERDLKRIYSLSRPTVWRYSSTIYEGAE